jgi:CHAT domain-containing protein
VLLDYYCAGETVGALALGRSAVRNFADLASLRDVERQINRWRFNLESARLAILDGRPAVELADEAHAVLQALYELLVTPLESHLTDVQSLWISPHAVLWAVPFTALYDGDHYLIERWTLTCLPGVIGLGPSKRREGPILTEAPVIVGYSDGERLSYAVSEARTVATALGGGDLLLEEEVTTGRLRRAAESCTLLHLATHGFFREDAPLFSALHLADDLLTAERLEGWRMPRVDLVTLSACETGVRLSRGSDLLGLARGFWRAGARRLVVSLWAVDDVSTADLMVHFYDGVRAGQSPPRALRSAQITALTKYRHPFYWAGFEALEIV